MDFEEMEKERFEALDRFVHESVYNLQFLWRYFNRVVEYKGHLGHSVAEVKIDEREGDKRLNFLTVGVLTGAYAIPHDDFAAIEYLLYELYSKAKDVYFDGDEKPFSPPEPDEE